MDKIKNIIFDVTGVLAEDTTRRILIEHGFNRDEIDEFEVSLWSYNGRKIRKRWEKGYLNSNGDELTNECEKYCVKNNTKMLSFSSDAYDMVKELHSMGYGIYIVGDLGCNTVFDIKAKKFQFYPGEYIDGAVWSSVEHRRKPSINIYETLFERYHLVPRECLYLDDEKENIDTGKSLGMYCVMVKGPDDTVSFLKNCAKENGVNLSNSRIVRPFEKGWSKKYRRIYPARKVAAEDIEKFIKDYFDKGETVYPSEICGRFSISMLETCNILDELADKDILTSKLRPYCPSCHRFINKPVLTVFDLPKVISCEHCGRKINDTWVCSIVIFEKL